MVTKIVLALFSLIFTQSINIDGESVNDNLSRRILGTVVNKKETNRTRVKFVLTTPFFMGSVFVASPYLALQRLRSMENWLPNYDVDIEWIDDEVYVNEIGKRLRHPNNPQTDYQ